jgi:DNA-binding NtrC family response regulator
MLTERVQEPPASRARETSPQASNAGHVEFVGRSAGATEVVALARRVAATDATVLLRGASGVGKEVLARFIHARSRRASGPLVVVDCASLHENLLQAELFGHERGAFTGAVDTRRGLIELADGGTLFLDEIGELAPAHQVRLLRFLESHRFRRVGGTTDRASDVRVIAATNRPLEAMLADGRFREDLYHRLNVFAIAIPPLVDRIEDLPLLAAHLVGRRTAAGSSPVRIGPTALECLMAWSWPGNVRELANVLERAIILADGAAIGPEHLPSALARGGVPGSIPSGTWRLDDLELRHVARALEACHGHRRQAADLLGISERTLYRLLKRLAAPTGTPAHDRRL